MFKDHLICKSHFEGFITILLLKFLSILSVFVLFVNHTINSTRHVVT